MTTDLKRVKFSFMDKQSNPLSVMLLTKCSDKILKIGMDFYESLSSYLICAIVKIRKYSFPLPICTLDDHVGDTTDKGFIFVVVLPPFDL